MKSVKNLTIEQPCNTVWLGKYKHIKRCAWNSRRVIWNSASCHEIQYGYTRAQHDKHMMSCPSNWVIWMTILCYYFCFIYFWLKFIGFLFSFLTNFKKVGVSLFDCFFCLVPHNFGLDGPIVMKFFFYLKTGASRVLLFQYLNSWSWCFYINYYARKLKSMRYFLPVQKRMFMKVEFVVLK